MYYEYDLDKLADAFEGVSDEDLYNVVVEYCQDNGYDYPFDQYTLEDYVENMKPYDAFMLGKMMKGSLNDGLYMFNGYGNVVTTTETDFANMYRDEPGLFEYIVENDLIDDIGLDSEDFIIEEGEY